MKKILVPTDFSDNANNALEFAIALAKKNNASITLLNVYAIPMYDPNMPAEMLRTSYEDLGNISKEEIKNNLEIFNKKYPDLQIDTLSRMGVLDLEIASTATEGKFDCIVMGTQGASGLEETLIGSNASSVVSKTEIPVFCIPSESKYNEIAKAVMPVELDGSEMQIINDARNLLPDCAIHVVNFKTEEERLPDKQQKIFENISSACKENESAKIVISEDVSTGLDETLRKYNCDLVIVSTVKRNIFENLFHKSISKKLVCHTHVPLLAIHKK